MTLITTFAFLQKYCSDFVIAFRHICAVSCSTTSISGCLFQLWFALPEEEFLSVKLLQYKYTYG